MKRFYLTLTILLFIIWPQHKSDAREERPTIETLIRYQQVKYKVLNYQIEKRIERIEKRIDSIKDKP